MFPGIIFHSFPTPPLSLREKSDMLCYFACPVRRDSTLGDLSLEQKTVLHELDTPFLEEREEISIWALRALKENKVGSQEPEEECQGFL